MFTVLDVACTLSAAWKLRDGDKRGRSDHYVTEIGGTGISRPEAYYREHAHYAPARRAHTGPPVPCGSRGRPAIGTARGEGLLRETTGHLGHVQPL